MRCTVPFVMMGSFLCVQSTTDAVAAPAAVVPAERYGAAGDGNADDAGAIQRAIEAVKEAGGGVVTFTSGRIYALGKGIVVGGDGVVLSGPGATLRLRDEVNTKAVLLVAGTEDRKVSDVSVLGLTVDANYGGQTKANKPRGIYVLHALNVRLDGVTVKNAWVSIDFGRGAEHSAARRSFCRQFYNDGFEVSGTGTPPRHDPHHILFVDCHTSDPQPEGADNAWEIEDGAHDVAVIACSSQRRQMEVRNHKTGDTVSKNIYFVRSTAPRFNLRGRPQAVENWVEDVFFYGSSGTVRKGARVRGVVEVGREGMSLRHDAAAIPAGMRGVVVGVPGIAADSEVFVAATGPTGGRRLSAGPPRPGVGFEVRVEEADRLDIGFEWWAVAPAEASTGRRSGGEGRTQ